MSYLTPESSPLAPHPSPLTTGLYAEIACVWEVTARKPGNVHRGQDFADVSLVDFLLSAASIAPVLNQAAGQPVGETILRATEATRRVVSSNTNLGIILLLAPLAAVSQDEELRSGVERVLAALDIPDAQAVFAAIRLARPGALGEVSEQDVHGEPTRPLREIMALAGERDLIALQYDNGFREVFDEGVPALQQGLANTGCLENAIIFTHLCLLAMHPDSLIARKRGKLEADEASRWAKGVLDSDWPGARGRQALDEFDRWLRAHGRGRNPGTTADLVTASLFVALRRGIITLPSPWPWSLEPQP